MKRIILPVLIACLFASCASKKATLAEQYPGMYEESPLTIAIMPPINRTTHAEAKDYFYTTMYLPLCEKGYYVYSPYLTMSLYQQESAYDAELFLESDLSVFQDVLGADAAMFTIIKDWRRNNLGGKITVNVEYILRSTKTGKTLYSREGDIKLDTSSGGSGLLGVAMTVLSTAITDKVEAGRACNAYVLSNLPAGKYSSSHGKDGDKEAGKSLIKGTVKK